jgi:hypothetical protein
MSTATISDPRERAVRAGLVALSAATLGLAAFMAADPRGFVADVGPFGEANAHYVRDLSTFTAAYGAGLAIAVMRPSWRVPVLGVGVIQGVLHLVNHVADAGAADPPAMGVVNAVLVAALTAVTAWLLVTAARAEEGR